MASDDLRARIAEALEAADYRAPMRRGDLADAVLPVVQPLLARRDKRIEEYRVSRKRWMDAAFADRGDAVRAAAERDGLRVELDELLDRLDDGTVGPDQAVAMLLDQLAELLPDADPTEDMEHYLRQARVGHRRALRARDRRLAAEAERDRALAALQAVREAQSLGEALAAVAKHDGLTTDEEANRG